MAVVEDVEGQLLVRQRPQTGRYTCGGRINSDLQVGVCLASIVNGSSGNEYVELSVAKQRYVAYTNYSHLVEPRV